MTTKNTYYSKDLVIENVTLTFHSLFEKSRNPNYPKADPKFSIKVTLDKNDENNAQIERLKDDIKELFMDAFGEKIPSTYKNNLITDGDSFDLSENARKYSAGKWVIGATSGLDTLPPIFNKGRADSIINKSDNLINPGCTVDLIFRIMLHNANDQSRGIAGILCAVDFRKESTFGNRDVTHLLRKHNDIENDSQEKVVNINNDKDENFFDNIEVGNNIDPFNIEVESEIF